MLPRIPVLPNRDILAKLDSLEERRQLKSANEAASLKRKLRQGAQCLVRVNSLWDEPLTMTRGSAIECQEKWVPATVLSTVLRAPFSSAAEGLDEDLDNDEDGDGDEEDHDEFGFSGLSDGIDADDLK